MSWTGAIMRHRAATGADLVKVAHTLAADEDAPPMLRELARSYASATVYRAGRKSARASDPATSREAGRRASRGPKVHAILAALVRRADAAGPHWSEGQRGLTAQELHAGSGDRGPIPGAWKRTSELLADGLVEVVKAREYDAAADVWRDGTEWIRNGGRILRITDDGRAELARLDAKSPRSE